MVDVSMAVAIYGFVPKQRRIEEAGISYETSVVKHKLTLGQATTPVYRPPAAIPHVDSTTSFDEEELGDWLDNDDAKYEKYISKQDPNNWKDQDHYKVLGLSKLRYKATSSQLKTAYRQKVLKYHPDKGKVKTGRNEAIFACIQKAYEQLGDSVEKRRAYDSVDPKFDEGIPEPSSISRENFFDLLRPVFEQNARFSVEQPVPDLGAMNSPRQDVEAFYDFWYNWKSWREFSYLDEEDKTKGEDRWERREIEKLNKAEREKRRKQDVKCILKLVEMAYEKDPRISAFKEAEKREKEQDKERRRQERERKAAEKRAQEEEEERRRDAERQKQQEEERLVAQAKQKQKKALTAQRKALRELALGADYWTKNADQQHAVMEHVERVCINADFDEMAELCQRLLGVKLYDEAVALLKEVAKKNATATVQPKAKTAAHDGAASWTTEEIQLLVKAANLYPPGTVERWKQVAQYIADHCSTPAGKLKNEKDIIKQVKALKVIEASQPVKAAVAAAANAQFSLATSGANKENGSAAQPASTEADEWSAAQQKQLETALKAIPASDTDRWDKIAAAVTGKSKKECVQRYKKLAQLVKQGKKN